ncbi:uncharacterized protein LOC142340880 [Convolutriloba macropyga]|uniref:uncharacterized protein LOC142340880 n=1 Tax=Convolutriloba macropyga TaxID=536237 RepID=UPI003F51EB4F
MCKSTVCLLCLLGLIMSAVGILFYVVACAPLCNGCSGMYENVAGETMTTTLAMHLLAMFFLITACVLFGVALCCEQCRTKCGYMVGLVVCCGVSVLFGLVAVAYFASKFPASFWSEQITTFVVMLIMGMLFGVAALVMAIIAMACKGREEQKGEKGGSGTKKGGKK